MVLRAWHTILLNQFLTAATHHTLYNYLCRQEAAAAAYRDRLVSTSAPGSASPSARASRSRQPGRSTGGSRGHHSGSSRPRSRSSSYHSSSVVAAAEGGSPGRSSRVKPVPDFAVLHEEWEGKLSHIKASNRRRVTVPQV